MAQLDYVYQIAEICAALGIENAIICPGSRSAPLTISFVRHPKIKTHLIFDERSAAYIALGMAQKSKKTVVLICTSGTAALNFAPAVAEAYWQQIPLLVLTGDRPAEWIGQGDGQTINQNNIYAQNCKASYLLPTDKHHTDSIWMLERTVCEAIFKTTSQPFGPVHINVPAREPFYPKKDEDYSFGDQARILKGVAVQHTLQKEQWEEIICLILDNKKVLVVAGHQLPDSHLFTIIDSFLENNNLPLLADVNSNLMGATNAVLHYDLLISSFSEIQKIEFQPDLLISFGNEFVSKALKQYSRKSKPKWHLHISENDNWIDTFQSVTHFIKVSPAYFFTELGNKTRLSNDKKYTAKWLDMNSLIASKVEEYHFKNAYNELSISQRILKNIPENSVVHLSNSLPVRYANLLGIQHKEVYCNRGTSGIDGCVSTAVGSALQTEQLVTLFIGDVAFLYDRNAFWHNELASNLRFVVINNGGGQIFRTIEGAKDQPELDAFFVGNQKRDMQFIAKENGLEYTKVEQLEGLKNALTSFFKIDNRSKILEIITDGKEALNTIQDFKEFVSSNN